MTEKQKRASNPKSSVWVAASAGTGKTKVLTDRVLRLLLEGVAPEKILCLTFTNAAAAEMANRINKELGVWVSVSDADLTKKLYDLTQGTPDIKILSRARQLFLKVLEEGDGINIQTIHSFCQSLMRRFPFEAKVSPHFQIIDDYTSSELLSQARAQLITGKAEQEVVLAVREVSWRFSDKSFTELLDAVIAERGKIESLLDNHSLAGLVSSAYQELGVDENVDENTFMQEQLSDDALAKSEMTKICNIMLEEGSKTDIARATSILEFLHLPIAQRVENFTAYREVFLTKPTGSNPEAGRKVLVTKKIASKYDFVEQALRLEQARILQASDKVKAIKIAQLTKDLLLIVKSVLQIYSELKSSRAFMDYSDLILASRRLLADSEICPWVLYKLDGGVDHLLVDEAQDTSPEQWQVIESLCEEFFSGQAVSEADRTIFVVGDEKQSIFSFQGADPEIFNKMHKFFAQKCQLAKKSWESISLDMSFRSSSAVLKLVDAVFSDPVLQQSISTNSEVTAHAAFRSDDIGKFQIWPLCIVERKKQENAWQMPVEIVQEQTAKQEMAIKIAEEIEYWLKNKRLLLSKGRPVEPGDIMILVRKRDDFVKYMISELKSRRVEVAGIDRMVITDHIAVMDLMALGDFCLLPEDDLTLACLLKSPLIGMSEEDLFDLAHARGSRTLWQALYFKRQTKQIYSDSYNYLLDILAKVDVFVPFEIYSYVIDSCAGRKKFVARLGVEANDPIDEFLLLAANFERTHIPSLQGFLHWIRSGANEVKRDFEQGINSVRIMTVHGSKGLQSPIVFLPDTASTPSSKGSIMWDISPKSIIFWNLAIENSYCASLKKNAKSQEYDEYIRLLYVALTRSEDEIYISGYSNSESVSDDCWYSIIKKHASNIGKKNDQDIIEFTSGSKQAPLQDVCAFASDKIIDLPEYLKSEVDSDKLSNYKITPSRQDDNYVVYSPLNVKKILRGKIIHKLFEYLPGLPNPRQAADNFLQSYRKDFSLKEIKEIAETVHNIIEDDSYSYLFSKNVKPEVPIVGKIGDKTVSGQIDSLIVLQDKVIIAEYKTTKNIPKDEYDVKTAYLKQISAYYAIIKKIYVNHSVEAVFIWVDGPKIMKISTQTLEKYIP